MGEWSFLSSFLEYLQNHSPMVGRIWLVVMLIFRILILATVASDMFEDEQEEFACNTLQPGCKQVCYDKAFPISHYRFWVFHIVLLSGPSICFVIYAMHHASKIEKEKEALESGVSSNKSKRQTYNQEDNLRKIYIGNVAFRLLLEVGFTVGQWALYGFKVEAQFPCERFPCPYTVDCFVSRPMEKTIFLLFYFAVGVLSAVLSLVELITIILKRKSRGKTSSYEKDNRSNSKQERSETLLLAKFPP
uniref:Gap junction protein n=2 Tax=Latimeria chalumnae TaxID=7897 RepID=H3AJ15_LATCH